MEKNRQTRFYLNVTLWGKSIKTVSVDYYQPNSSVEVTISVNPTGCKGFQCPICGQETKNIPSQHTKNWMCHCGRMWYSAGTGILCDEETGHEVIKELENHSPVCVY